MTELPLPPADGGERFPDFDVVNFEKHWDSATRRVVEDRLASSAPIVFFTPAEEAAATALFDQLLFQRGEPKVPVTEMVDSRLAQNDIDGWHYDTMPPDDVAWRTSLAALDDDAIHTHRCRFSECSWDAQETLLASIHDAHANPWHGMPSAQVWSLWTRYACTAFYSHPWAWNEIGFAGPAYPRGYKNMGIDRREPFEVPDAKPRDDPIRKSVP